MSSVYEPVQDSAPIVEAQPGVPPTMEEICNKFFDDIERDPKALGRYMAELREVCGDIEFTSEEAWEMWEDCPP